MLVGAGRRHKPQPGDDLPRFNQRIEAGDRVEQLLADAISSRM